MSLDNNFGNDLFGGAIASAVGGAVGLEFASQWQQLGQMAHRGLGQQDLAALGRVQAAIRNAHVGSEFRKNRGDRNVLLRALCPSFAVC